MNWDYVIALCCRSPFHEDGGFGMSPSEVANMTFAQLRVHTTELKTLKRKTETVNSFAEAKALRKARKQNGG